MSGESGYSGESTELVNIGSYVILLKLVILVKLMILVNLVILVNQVLNLVIL